MKKFLPFYLLFYLSTSIFGQTGPAGIGNFDGSNGQPENIIWLDASTIGLSDGDPILTWSDLSGNGNDLVQQGADATPLFETNGLFGANHSVARFDGTERYLRLDDNADLDNALGGITVIGVIFNPILDGSPRGIYSKRNSSSAQQSYSAFTWSGPRLHFDVHNGGNRRLASTTTLNTSTDYIFSNRYSGTLQEIFLQTAAAGTNSTTGNISNTSSNLILGALNNNYGTYYNGDIAELIFYREALNDGQRLIVENYLSQKYGISISNDFFGTDASFNAAFVNDIMGIGTGNGTDKQSISGESSALQIEEGSSSLNASNEFVMFAHDNTSFSDVTSDIVVDPGILDSRWERSWYMEATGGVSISFRFDFGDAGRGVPTGSSDYVLLYRASTADNFTRVATNSYSIENTDQLVVDLTNSDLPTGYYTIGIGEPVTTDSWYSFQSGDWNDPLTWTTDPSGALRVPVTGGVPTAADNAVILTGRTVTMDSDDNDGVGLTVNGRLDIVNTSGHNFFNINGNGTISFAGDVSNNDNFPSGSTSGFADATVGGTVEIIGTGVNLNSQRTFNNVTVNLTGGTDVATLLADYTINGDLTIQNGIFQINDNSATTNLNLDVFGTVQVDASGEINVGTANARHEFNFYGDFINNGRAEFTNRSVANYGSEATDGIVDANFLNGSADQSIHCNGITNFYRIEIDKGANQTYILDINALSAANFNLFGPADYGHSNIAQLTTNDNALGLLRGTVRLNANVDVPVLNNTGNYNISESARLWVNGGSAEKPGGTAIVPYGTVQISDGVLNAPVNSGITTRDNGNIIVEGGVVTVNQIRTSVLGVENIGGYTQSGGTVNVTGNNISTSYYVFSLTYPGNTFNMSGGTLNVSGAVTGSNTGGIFIASNESNQSVTGGTVVMEINRNDDFKVTSLAPFWNVIMRYTSGSGSEVDLINGSSGTGGNITTITTPDLRVLNDLIIEDGILFDHNGFDVEIGSDFTIQSTGDYFYDAGTPNTTTFNGVDDATLTFLNRTGGSGDEQTFWNLIIDKPTDKTVFLASGKTNVNGSNNNLINVDGRAFKVLSGTLDNGLYSIRVFADSLVNYDVLGVYDPAAAPGDASSNGNNDFIKLTDQPITLVTADTSRFGNVRFNNENDIVELTSDVYIERFQYRFGRMNLGEHNLKIDALDINLRADRTDWNGCGGCFSVEDMFIIDGNASDGGLSLYVPADGLDPEDGDATFDFPFGVGTDGVDVDVDGGNSKYTPASVTVSGVTDDGYITIRPVDNVLATSDGSGGDILSYYWRVDFEDFTTLPNVEYNFTYYDDDLDGSSNESSFVAGKVLEIDPFTRNYEDDGVPENEGVDDTNNVITFNGPSDSGFLLEEASYTAGESGRFIGAPTVYYSTTVNNGNDTNFGNGDRWDQSSRWSTVGHYSGTNTGTFPQAGDIAIMAFGLANSTATTDNSQRAHWFFVNSDTEAAKLIFSETVENADGIIITNDASFQPQLIIDADNALDVTFGTVEGNGTFNVQLDCSPCNIDPSSSTVISANITADFGLFADVQQARFDFDLYSNNNSSVFMPSAFPSTFPNVNIKGQGGNGRRLVFQDDITINRDLALREGAYLRLGNTANGDITVGRNLNLTINNDGDVVEFPEDGPGRTLTITGDINMDNNNDEILVLDNNSSADVTISRLRVGGSINQSTGQINLYSGSGADRDQVELEVFGNTDETYTVSNPPDMSLFRLIVNKGTDKTATFSMNNDFSLNGDTDGSVKALELINGTLILNDPGINIDLTTGGDSFEIPAEAALQLTQGTASVSGDDSGILLDGCIIIDGGALDMDDAVGNGNNFIEYSASGNAILEISDGTLDVGSQIRGITSAETGVLKYRQIGGDVRIGTQAAPEGSRGMLQIYNANSEFTYTGGTLTIERHQTSPTVAALFLDPAQSDVTGSTITIFNGNTPAGQNDFRINSTIALENLTINGTNNPTAEIDINPLTIDGNLTIASGATLNGNALTLTVGGDFDNDGTYDAQGNETIFNSTGTQQITGAGTNTFFRFTKSETGILDLTNTLDVADLFTISDGILSDNGFSVNLAGDAVIDGTHSSGVGNGLVFGGGPGQQLRRSAAGTGTLGVVTINNANGVTIPDGNGYNFNIDGGLRLQNGVFNVGGSIIALGINALITPVSPFGASNMIRTNSSFTDGGVAKTFPASFSQDFTFPVGQAFYTPVIFDFTSGSNTSGSSVGTITVLPANEFHPTINDGSDFFGTGDINNVLQYYWTVEANGITGLTTDMTMGYDDSQVLADDPGSTEADYIAARILSQNNPTFDINKFTTAEVDEAANLISFNFIGASDNGISGDYFAGIDEAIPDNVPIYTVDVNGNFGDDVYDNPVPGGGAPSGAVVIVPNSFTLTLDADNANFYRTEILAGGVLEVDNSTNHRLGELSGTGDLRIISDGVNANLPAFSGSFLSCSGGGLEYGGTGSYNILGGITELRNLTLLGSGDRDFPNNNVTVCEDLIVDGPTVILTSNRTLNVQRNLQMDNGDLFTGLGSISRLFIDEDLFINGGSFNGASNGRILVLGSLYVAGGNFNMGTGNIFIVLRENFEFQSGSINSQNSQLILNSDSFTQNMIGDFTGSNSLFRLDIDNRSGSQNFNLNGDLEITSRLSLIDGILNVSNGNSISIGSSALVIPSIGNSNSFIEGKVLKTISSAGQSFTFPIGDAGRWRPASVNNVSVGGQTWEAQFFAADATNEATVDNYDLTNPTEIATILQSEYWKISDGNLGASGNTATVGLSWGIESDVSSVFAEREELEVMIWNDAISSWDNLDGVNFSSGHTQTRGRFVAGSANSFSEQIFTLGSATSNNALPVTLVSFEGELVGSAVKLTWATSSEINNDYFVIEHSTDGINYNQLAEIDGAGDSFEMLDYIYYHERPQPGHNFYRLKQVDFDGTTNYEGNTIAVFVPGEDINLDILPLPNPATQDELSLLIQAQPGKVKVDFFDMRGILLYSEVVDTSELNQGQFKPNLNGRLKAGIYILSLQQGVEFVKKRVMIVE